jgi:hypothetical protein
MSIKVDFDDHSPIQKESIYTQSPISKDIDIKYNSDLYIETSP